MAVFGTEGAVWIERGADAGCLASPVGALFATSALESDLVGAVLMGFGRGFWLEA